MIQLIDYKNKFYRLIINGVKKFRPITKIFNTKYVIDNLSQIKFKIMKADELKAISLSKQMDFESI